MALAYTRPYLYPKQSGAFFHDYRYGLCEASTKAGKTVAAIAWILEKAFHGKAGQNFWWVAPVADQAKIAFSRIKSGLSPGTFTPIESPTPKITLLNGVVIWFKSGDNPDSLFGEDVYGAVVDEASRVKEESWHALRSTITATRGQVRIIGNVKGRKNWFFHLARMAEKDGPEIDMHYSKITVLDAIAAGVIDQREVEDARRVLPEHVFRELYFAEPAEGEGNPFGESYINLCLQTHLSDSPPVAFGIDVAKKGDWWVIIGLDAAGNVCVFQRWRGRSWQDSIRSTLQIVGEDVPALVDSTGVGDPILEALQSASGGNFRGYMFTNVSKQKLMEGLAVSIQSREIGFPDGPIRIELESFEYQSTPTRTFYSAPSGMNDDCVCALALAREQFSTQIPGNNLIGFYRDQFRQSQDRLRREELGVPDPSLGDEFVNELTLLYSKTLDEYQPEESRCFECGQTLGLGSRVSDGVHKWHVGCI